MARVDIGQGWFVQYTNKSTRESQDLIYDCPGTPSDYHRGQKSEWQINGVTGEVFYCDGDPDRRPSKSIVGRASEALKQLDEQGLLFIEAKRVEKSIEKTDHHGQASYMSSRCDKTIDMFNE